MNGNSNGDNCESTPSLDGVVAWDAGFTVLSSDLFDSAILQMSVNSEEFKKPPDALNAKRGFPCPETHTPWHELCRKNVGRRASGACIEMATRYRDIATRFGTRHLQ